MPGVNLARRAPSQRRMRNNVTPKRRLLIAGAAIALLLGALTLAWKYTGLGESLSPEAITGWLEAVSGKWWAPVLMVLIYTPASIVMFPRPILTLAAVAVFGPLYGFTLAMAGVLLAAFLGWLAGRNIDEERLRKWAGPRLDKIKRVLRKEGLFAMAAVGLLPIAPFPIEVLVAGALRVKLFDLLGGVFIAMLPGMLGMTVLGHQLMAALHGDRKMNLWVIAATVLALAAVAWFTHRWWKRVQAQVG